MRPIERQKPILELLATAWAAHPDQRLGQIIGNAARDPNDINHWGYGEYRDPYTVEDDELWAGLERMVPK